MLITTNPAGWVFVWPAKSDFIEVYHDDASFSDQPVDVIVAGTMKYSDAELRRFANESPDYGRPYV